jgi:hypothetical protein
MPGADDAYRDHRFHVAAKRCDQCLYSSANIVGDKRRDSILKGCRASDRYFICHKSTIAGTPAVCRGFFDEERNTSCQVAERLGLVVYVNLGERK